MSAPALKSSTFPEHLNHAKPIALRLTDSEWDRAFKYAKAENRSASNFARFIFLRGLTEYERDNVTAAH
jgi:hypothetical protein